MKKVLVNYGGAILLYLVVFFGIVAINASLKGINVNTDKYVLNKW